MNDQDKDLPPILPPLIDNVPSLRATRLALEQEATEQEATEQEKKDWGRLHSRLIHYESATSFQVQDEEMLFPRPRWLSLQVVHDPRYRSEGRMRQREDHCYFCYTLEGEGGFSGGQGTCRVGEGQGFLMEIDDPDAAYFYPPDAREPWRFLAFTFVGLPAKAMVRALTERHGAHFTLDPQTPALRRLMTRDPHEFAAAKISAAEGARLVMDLLLALTESAEIITEITPELALVRRAMQALESEAGRNMQVGSLAVALGVSREHLARAFQRQLQQSPSRFIRARKMQRACFLLKGTSLTVPQVAAALGYADSTNFIHAFRQAVGMTPGQFRLHGRLSLMTA